MTWSGASSGEHFVASNPPLGNAVTLVAAPNGTDDTTALQAAIDGRNTAANNAVPAPGGIVQLQAGTYIADNLIIPSGVTLQGAGIEATVLQLKAGVAVSHALLSTKNFDTLTGTNPGSGDQGPYNFGLRDLTFDGNKANNASNTAIGMVRTYGYGFHVENVRFRSSKTGGWYSEWSSNANDPALGDSMEAHVLNVKVHDNGGDGVIWNGPHDSNWGNAESYHNGAAGFWIKVNGNNTKFENVHAWHASQTYGFNCDATAYFTGCLSEGASVAQVKFQANDCSWIGGNVFATGAGFVGFQLGPTGLIAGTHINTKISGCNSASSSPASSTPSSLPMSTRRLGRRPPARRTPPAW
jgi:hypothetical protein